MSLALHMLGYCLSDQAKFDDAVRYLKEALEVKRTLNNKEDTAPSE